MQLLGVLHLPGAAFGFLRFFIRNAALLGLRSNSQSFLGSVYVAAVRRAPVRLYYLI